MSCSKWRWTPACDHEACPGDCDFCGFDPEEDEEDVPDAKAILVAMMMLGAMCNDKG